MDLEKTAQLQKKHQALTEATSATSSPPPVKKGHSEQSVLITADKGRMLVFDNFDFKQQVHSMTEAHQNVDVDWVSHLSVENHLLSDKPAAYAVKQMENGLCLPSRYEHHLQRENYITLTERAIVEPVWNFSSQWSVSTYHTNIARRWLRNQKWYYIIQLSANDCCNILVISPSLK